MKGRTQTFRPRRRTAAGTTVCAAAAPAGLSMSVAENLLDTEHTLNPSSHLGFLLSCLSVCLSVCLSDVVNEVVKSYTYRVLVASYFGLLVQPNEPDQPDPNFDPEGQPNPTQPDFGP